MDAGCFILGSIKQKGFARTPREDSGKLEREQGDIYLVMVQQAWC